MKNTQRRDECTSDHHDKRDVNVTKLHTTMLRMNILAVALSSVLTALRGNYGEAVVHALGAIGVAFVAPAMTRPHSFIATSRIGHVLLYALATLSILSVIGNVVLLLQGG